MWTPMSTGISGYSFILGWTIEIQGTIVTSLLILFKLEPGKEHISPVISHTHTNIPKREPNSGIVFVEARTGL